MDVNNIGIAAAVGAVLPLLIAVFVQWGQSDAQKSLIAFVTCAVAAVATAYVTDAIHFTEPGWDWVAWFGTVYASAMTLYARFWKPTGVTPQIELRTSLHLPDGKPRGR